MRRIALGLIAATFLSGNAFACMQPSTQKALDVVGLKSTLMVGALACNQRQDYDTFMTRFQPHILAEQHRVDAYFRRRHGRAFHKYEDSYITSLANVQSSAGIHEGSNFCGRSETLFGKVLALKTQTELDDFARQAPAVQPIVMVECGIVESSAFRRMERLAPRP
ncbi:hypothetical protein AiwAL_08240 [Acidiphilium sp. AL]|uniref:Uncharacterized protein n=1 Tax=Acidiphilium iwatense TaxID=768198 RepID=A0ABS9E271_9PROT|nr:MULTISPECIES: hypothetical protein [Acidiphilium]MCF3947742.1 hypothetical protein [Acidiphilium iwatense]MCU4160097.1 hypothetical protein [Acidiphilium sp. AL]